MFKNIKTKNLIMLGAMFALALMFASPALAHSAASQYIPSSQQLQLGANDMYNKIFIQHITGGQGLMDMSNSPFAGVIGAINGVLLVVAGILAAYTMLMGTVNTAHDGELLGQKWSSAWLPIRMSMGTSLLLPVFKGGFCLIQIIIIWLAMQGGGLANYVWGYYVNNGANMAAFSPSINQNQMENVAYNMLKSNMCTILYNNNNQYLRKEFNQKGLSAPKNQNLGFHLYPAKNSNGVATKYIGAYGIKGNVNHNSPNQNKSMACGMFRFNNLASHSKKHTKNLHKSMSSMSRSQKMHFLKTNVSNGLTNMQAKIDNAQLTQIKHLQKKMHKLAAGVVNKKYQKQLANNPQFVLNKVNKYAKVYIQNIEKAAQQAYNKNKNLQNFKKQLKKDGWIMAGVYFNRNVQLNNETQNAINNFPFFPTKHNQSTNGYMGYPKRVQNQMTELEDNISSHVSGVKQMSVANGKTNHSKASRRSSSILHRITGWITGVTSGLSSASSSTGSTLFNHFVGQNENMMTVINQASNILQSIGVAVALGGLTLGSVKIFGTGLNAGTAMWIFTISMWAATAFFAYRLIFLIPLFMWIAGVVRYFIRVCLALVGSGLWMISVIHPDADGFVGRGGQGYMLALTLLVSPTLMIFAWITSLILLQPVSFFINTIVGYAINPEMGAGSVEIYGFFMPFIVYAFLAYRTLTALFGIINTAPEEILTWLNSGIPNLGGREAQGIAEGIQGSVVGAAAAVGYGGKKVGEVAGKGVAGASQKGSQGIDSGLDSMSKQFGQGETQDTGQSGSMSGEAPSQGSKKSRDNHGQSFENKAKNVKQRMMEKSDSPKKPQGGNQENDDKGS